MAISPLTTFNRCYERTQPDFNRAYVDIDGRADSTMPYDVFGQLVHRAIIALLSMQTGYLFSVMESCKTNCTKKEETFHKLSFRLIFIGLYGTKDQVKQFVINNVNPLIHRAMEEIGIPFMRDSKQPRGPTYVESDDSVYNGPVKQGSCGRKMRLLHSVKDDEPQRPLRLHPQLGGCRVPVDARPIDTLIQFIPRGAVSLDTIPVAAVSHDKPVQVTVHPRLL